MNEWKLQSREAMKIDGGYKEGSPKFYNRNGTLTKYAFSCGYVEHYYSKDGNNIKLWKDSIVYIVDSDICGEKHRQVFASLTSARLFVRNIMAM